MEFYSCSRPVLIWEGDSLAVPQMAGLPAVSCAEEDKYCVWCRRANVGKSTGRPGTVCLTRSSSEVESTV